MIFHVFSTYPSADASRRLRIDPIVRLLRKDGHKVLVHTIFSPWVFANKNSNGLKRPLVLARFAWAMFATSVRILLVRGDVALVHREAFPIFTPLAEKIIRRRFSLLVLDVDDAIFAQPTHIKDWRTIFRNAKNASVYSDLFDLIVCGNPSLAEAFSGSRASVMISPTCPSSDVVDALSVRDPQDRFILWTGSQSTLGSLKLVLPEVLRACEAEKLRLVVLGGRNIDSLPAHMLLDKYLWTEAREAELVNTAWLGLMPLPDSPWERGKSGYKAILYLSAGLPSLVSPIGMNSDLIRDYPSVQPCVGDWREAISTLARGDQAQYWEEATRSRDLAKKSFDQVINARRVVSAVYERAAASASRESA